MKKYSSLVAALILGLMVFSSVRSFASGGGDTIIATEISADDAAKKYPPQAGKGYPQGVATTTSTGGFFQSPYSSRVYDCRKVKHGALILDEGAKKVFVRP